MCAQLARPPSQTSDTAAQLKAFVSRRGEELGKTLRGISSDAGLARSYLYKLVGGEIHDPSVRVLHRLACALEVSPVSLYRLYGSLSAPISAFSETHLRSSCASAMGNAQDVALVNPDYSTPYHHVVLGGEVFKKTWEIQNIGRASWSGRRLVRKDVSCQCSSKVVGLVSLEREIAIPETLPGATARLETHFAAPGKNCSAAAVWRIEDRFNKPVYAPYFSLEVIVTVIAE